MAENEPTSPPDSGGQEAADEKLETAAEESPGEDLAPSAFAEYSQDERECTEKIFRATQQEHMADEHAAAGFKA